MEPGATLVPITVHEVNERDTMYNDSDDRTIMGPEITQDHPNTNFLLPPKLATETNRLQWREMATDWVETVMLYAEGGDK